MIELSLEQLLKLVKIRATKTGEKIQDLTPPEIVEMERILIKGKGVQDDYNKLYLKMDSVIAESDAYFNRLRKKYPNLKGLDFTYDNGAIYERVINEDNK